MIFVRCHRVGKPQQQRGRPIIVRFHHYADRELVWSRKTLLKGKAFSIHENFASEVEFKRKLLYPILTAAKKTGNYDRCYLNGDVLRISGKDFTVENLDDIPSDIHPSNLGVKSNNQWIIFGGIHSSYHFLSNFYSSSMTYRDITFDNLEHAKAIEFNDIDSSEDILCAQNSKYRKTVRIQCQRMEQCERNCYVGSFKDKVRPWFGDGKEIIGYCWQIPCRSRPIHNLHVLHRYVFIQQRLIQNR